MKQSSLHDMNSGMPVIAAITAMALTAWVLVSAIGMSEPPPTLYVAWLKPCETCEAIPHSVYKSRAEAETKAPKGATIKELK